MTRRFFIKRGALRKAFFALIIKKFVVYVSSFIPRKGKKLAKFEKAPSEMRPEILAAVISHVPFDGWSDAAIKNAAQDLGLPADFLKMAYGAGVFEMVEVHLTNLDTELEKALAKARLNKMKIRDRIRTAVLTRLELNEPNKEMVRRTVGFLALPTNAPLAAKCLWRTCDLMWRAAGDTATDYNHYTKRMILGGVYSTTLLTWLNDKSDGYQDTKTFLDRRIDNVMEFEKFKFKAKEATKDLPDPFEILGKIRYPEGHRK